MVTRTVVFPLNIIGKERALLQETVNQYTKAWNYCVDVAWGEEITNKRDLHDLTYYYIRKKFKVTYSRH